MPLAGHVVTCVPHHHTRGDALACCETPLRAPPPPPQWAYGCQAVAPADVVCLGRVGACIGPGLWGLEYSAVLRYVPRLWMEGCMVLAAYEAKKAALAKAKAEKEAAAKS